MVDAAESPSTSSILRPEYERLLQDEVMSLSGWYQCGTS